MENQNSLTPTAQDIVGKFADLPVSPKIDYKPAFFLRRGAAYLLDICILSPFYLIFALIILSTPVPPEEYNLVLIFVVTIFIILIVISFGYFIYFESTSGQTIGKRVFHIKTMRVMGDRVGWGRAVIRAIFRIFDIVLWPYIFIDSKKRRLGDLAAKTWVVKE